MSKDGNLVRQDADACPDDGALNAAAIDQNLTDCTANRRPDDGALNFATGMLVSELQLRTQPTQAGHALSRFQPARLSLGGMHLDYQYAWTLAPNQVGVRIRY